MVTRIKGMSGGGGGSYARVEHSLEQACLKTLSSFDLIELLLLIYSFPLFKVTAVSDDAKGT